MAEQRLLRAGKGRKPTWVSELIVWITACVEWRVSDYKPQPLVVELVDLLYIWRVIVFLPPVLQLVLIMDIPNAIHYHITPAHLILMLISGHHEAAWERENRHDMLKTFKFQVLQGERDLTVNNYCNKATRTWLNAEIKVLMKSIIYIWLKPT